MKTTAAEKHFMNIPGAHSRDGSFTAFDCIRILKEVNIFNNFSPITTEVDT